MKNPIPRVYQLLKRRRQASKLGINFRRSADFILPHNILLAGKKVELLLPQDHGSKVAFMDNLLDDCYRLRKLPNGIQTILDIGAHAGLFGLAARMRWPAAKIHAYEPNPQMQPFLERNAEHGNCRVFAEAVGLADGYISIDVGEDSVHTRTHADLKGAIRCVAFANAINRLGRRADLVKLDCEGAEWDILRDTQAWQKVDCLTMEFHLWAGYTLEELTARITQSGFNVRHCKFSGKNFGVLLAER
jgi:FkbM family methyltransferase